MKLLTTKKQDRFIDLAKPHESFSLRSMRCLPAEVALNIHNAEFQVFGFVLKVVGCKNLHYSSESDVWKVILLTSEQELLCIEIVEKGFILAGCFPKENSYIFMDNLVYSETTRIIPKDLSFRTYLRP